MPHSAQHLRDPHLVRRVNQLYHELTRDSFDTEHEQRFTVERPFWELVGDVALKSRLPRAPKEVARLEARLVIDLCCGTGFVTETLGRKMSGRDRIMAMDLSEAPLNTTVRKWSQHSAARVDRPRLIRVATDAQRLPLADNRADLVAINASLHHVPSPQVVLGEVDRILRPGGFFALGFEPNRTFFSSRPLRGFSTSLSRVSWYLSPRQNRRRLIQLTDRWGRQGKGAFRRTRLRPGGPPEADVLAELMNERLLNEGLIADPMSSTGLLDLVDCHARGGEEGGGFQPLELIRHSMPDYFAYLFESSDYLGETGRRWPRVRQLVDATLRMIAPEHGSLFSWLLRKPSPDGGHGV
ncbi:MAG TPA: class I SAM-dependent methyltransferase [Phycisphaerae bacterium]|nr:class I SAM-dependent methyltransferase [Phycisphaerae bacterium]HRY67908.1 class I SAM-dependent methyltransferase [Phycisphaerae bacterium]HSA26067.1 class I SAM-dependent methyltransferase [Phycisphaerae bacterium]